MCKVLAVNFKLILASLFLGLKPKSGSSHSTRSSQLNRTGRLGSWLAFVGRWISIVRPTFSQLSALSIFSQPFDANPMVGLRRPPRAPSLACALRHGRGVGSASSGHLGAGLNGSPSARIKCPSCTAPGSLCLTCSRRPRCSHGSQRNPRLLAVALYHPCYLSSLASPLVFLYAPVSSS